jgi:hypothetical protein
MAIIFIVPGGVPQRSAYELPAIGIWKCRHTRKRPRKRTKQRAYRSLYTCLIVLVGAALGYLCICKPNFCPNAYLSFALCGIAFL